MTRFLITIDTEHFTQAPSPVVMYPGGAWGTIDGRSCGFPLIMDHCDAVGIKATFFVNVFETALTGESMMRQMCDEILARGHDVQLHTHPAFRTGRPLLHDHLPEEQAELIACGARLLQSWTGQPPVAHRAGYYGVNADSLRALQENGIQLDCSTLTGRETCALHWSRFELIERDGMWVLPVSWFMVDGRVVKCDIDKAPAARLIDFTRRAIDEGYGFITFAAHSFSFLDIDANGTALFHATRANEFRKFVEFLASADGLIVQTAAQLWSELSAGLIVPRPDGRVITF